MSSSRGRKRKASKQNPIVNEPSELEELAEKPFKRPKSHAHNDTSGLLSLPVDVFELIADELFLGSRLITLDDVLKNEAYLRGSDFAYRADILKPLTQTCRALRKVYLPSFYEHWEACIVRTERAWYLQLAHRLEAMSKGLTGNPDLAKHVQIITVTLTRTSTQTVLPAFAESLSHLPNLHTLRVMHAHSEMTTALKKAFEGKKYPQIRTIVLPSSAHNVLRACPKAKDVTCNCGYGSTVLSAIVHACKEVEAVGGIDLSTDSAVKRLSKGAPKLKIIRARECDQLDKLEKLPLLSEIHLTLRVQAQTEDGIRQELESIMREKKMIKEAQRALEHRKSANKKIYVRYLIKDLDYLKTGEYNLPWKLGKTLEIDLSKS